MGNKKECNTVDELINQLQEIKQQVGGDTRVRLNVFGRELLTVNTGIGATGKADPWKVVSRGGVPCVFICE